MRRPSSAARLAFRSRTRAAERAGRRRHAPRVMTSCCLPRLHHHDSQLPLLSAPAGSRGRHAATQDGRGAWTGAAQWRKAGECTWARQALSQRRRSSSGRGRRSHAPRTHARRLEIRPVPAQSTPGLLIFTGSTRDRRRDCPVRPSAAVAAQCRQMPARGRNAAVPRRFPVQSDSTSHASSMNLDLRHP